MKALIIGATGATGKDLTNLLLQDADYTQVVIFVRRPSGLTHPKLLEVITDFERLDTVSEYIQGDVLFSCLGTTLKAAGTKDKQWHIDYEIPLQFAEIASRNGVPSLVLLSAYGASTKSRIFYSKMKGELEEALARVAFNQYLIFKPGILQRKNTDRTGERIMVAVLQVLNSLGIVRKFRPLSTLVLAEKLAKAPKVLGAGKHTIALDAIFAF